MMEGRFFFIFFERLDKFLRGVRLSLCKGVVPVVFFIMLLIPNVPPERSGLVFSRLRIGLLLV